MAKLTMVGRHGERTITKNGVTLTVVLPARAGVSWTDEERQLLLWRRAKGVSLDDLAIVHQRTRGAIRSELKHIREREQAAQRASEVHAILG